ncbi:MAG: hypothetical protein K0S09_137 [Sphingobacteriaceae bacterium]|jgi:hypothetical protein|nr:hypothetical protein [Sphingobacteriaceae bacterium]
MSTEVKCPSCGNAFPLEEAIGKEYEQELRNKMISWQKKKDEEYKQKDEEFAKREKQQSLAFDERLAKEKQALQLQMQESVRKSIADEYEIKLRMLENSDKDKEEKLKQARQKELEFLQREQQLKNKEAEMEIALQRKLQEQRDAMTEQIRKQEEEKSQLKETQHQLKEKELQKQLEDQRKLIEEMKRKSEQGSMQLQGEVQELIVEELLKSNFPFDVIDEVGKGVRGADCMQVVRNNFGQECGRIIYESKRTKDFGGDWIEKLKKDMRAVGADVAVIVTQCYPKGMDCFGEKDGVWICSFDELKAVAYVLRDGIIKLANATRSQENKGDKMHMLYDYLTSSEFNGQWKAISEGFMSMKLSIQQERNAMEKLWKSREKQLEKILLNAVHISGSVEGIAGKDIISLSLEGETDDALLLD